jgi:hypothetical protein
MRVASIPCLFDSFTNTFLYICLSHSCWAACACYFSDGLRNHWKHPYFLLGVCVCQSLRLLELFSFVQCIMQLN